MVKKLTKTKIISLYLNDYNKRYYLRELADLLKKPHQTVKPYVESLVEERVLIKNERKNITEYYLNFKDKKVYDHLVIAEKEKLLERLKEDTQLEILFEKLSAFFKKNTLIIFGSSVEKIRKESDIDLLIVGKQNLSKTIKDFEDVYNKDIHKIQVTNLEKLSTALIKEILEKHIILNNTEQIINFFGDLHEKNRLV